MATVYTVNINLSQRQFMAIGQITACWSFLEWHLGRAIARVYNIGAKEGRVFTATAQVGELTRMLRLATFLRIGSAHQAAILEQYLVAIEGLIGERNLVVHGAWAIDPAGAPHLMKYKGGSKEVNRIAGDATPMSDDDIEKIRDEILDATQRFCVWWNAQFGFETPTSRGLLDVPPLGVILRPVQSQSAPPPPPQPSVE